jgi:hypothetical protein
MTYPLAPPPPDRPPNGGESISLDNLGIQESETLRGVHIAGFTYAYAPGQPTGDVDLFENNGIRRSTHEQSPRLSPDSDSKTLEDVLSKAADYVGESTYVTPTASIDFSLSGSAPLSPITGSTASSSTALYSCTSFGELREALKARPSAKCSLPFSEGATDFQSNMADFGDVGRSRRWSNATASVPAEGELSRPTSILPRLDNEAAYLDSDTTGLGAKGLGLRKYASLDFDLDTVVSLELDPGHNRKTIDNSGTAEASATPSVRSGIPATRHVSFIDALASPEDAAVTPSTVTLDGSASPWKNLNKYYSPSPNLNKLRKKRTESTPVLSTTHRLQEKVDLPAGLQQIGLGIGYTYAGPPDPSRDKERDTGHPRRSVSLGSSVARCGALLSHIRRPKGFHAPNEAHQQERVSEESDAMDAVMREMYGDAWNADMGVGYLGDGHVQGIGSRRSVGKVYSVDEGRDELLGSTLRLVDTPKQRDPIL